MNPERRRRFDRLLEEVLSELPDWLSGLLAEVPVVVEDRPSRRMLREMGADDPCVVCGLYTGVPLTERSVEHSGTLPERIRIFRDGVEADASRRRGRLSDTALKRAIRITVLHEMGHHFGLDEQDLRELGYE